MSVKTSGKPGSESIEHNAPDQRIAINTFSRYISLMITMVVGFLLLPFLLRHIGKPAYGLQSLAHQALDFIAILAFAIGRSYDRIATTHYARRAYDRMNATLSAGLTLSILIGIIIAIAACLMARYADVLFDLPPQLLESAAWVLLIFGAGSALQIVSAPYRSPMYMTQKLYLDAIANMKHLRVVRNGSVYRVSTSGAD